MNEEDSANELEKQLIKVKDERYENILNAIPDIVYRIDTQGFFTYLNQAVKCLGYTPGDLIGKPFSVIIHPEDIPFISKSLVLPKFKGKKTGEDTAPKLFDERRGWLRRTQNLEVRLIAKNKVGGETNGEMIGSVIAFGEISAVGFYDDSVQEKKFHGTVGIIRDITERRKSEELLRKLYSAVDQIPISIIITDNKGNIEYINPMFIRVSGFSPGELQGENVRILKSGHHTNEFYDSIWASITQDKDWKGEILNKKKSGEFYWEFMTISALKNPSGTITHYIAVKEDISEKKKTAEQAKTLKEKDVLISEIHHRVKNNLQVITSLLNLQLDYIDDENIRRILKECQNRIKSMAIIHEKLYKASDLARIDFMQYIETLAMELLYSYNISPSKIKLKIDVKDIFFNINLATPIGLIINELVSNALLHAFKDKTGGEISITILADNDNYTLSIGDNGSGFPEQIDFQNTNTLGLQLVSLLVRQLRGQMNLIRHNGTLITLIFPKAE